MRARWDRAQVASRARINPLHTRSDPVKIGPPLIFRANILLLPLLCRLFGGKGQRVVLDHIRELALAEGFPQRLPQRHAQILLRKFQSLMNDSGLFKRLGVQIDRYAMKIAQVVGGVFQWNVLEMRRALRNFRLRYRQYFEDPTTVERMSGSVSLVSLNHG